jgi:hypothetical protein
LPLSSHARSGEACDGGHDVGRDFAVDFFETRFGARFRLGTKSIEVQWGAESYGDGVGAWQVHAAGEGLESALDAYGDDGGGGFDDQEADARPGGLELALWRAGAFGEQDDGATGAKVIHDGLQSRGAAAVAVDGDDVPGAKHGAEDGESEEVFASEVTDGAGEGCADERGVEETAMIGGEDSGSGVRDVLGAFDVPTAVEPEEGAEEPPRDAIDEFHAWRFRISSRIRAVVCSEERPELLMTVAPSGIMRGAAARWLSR